MRALVALFLALAACADAGDSLVDEVEVSPELDGKADSATELSVRAGDTTLWVQKVIARRDGPNGPELVLRGRTSRNLTDGRGFIFDDIYGDFAQKSARVFELTWPVSTARGLADGVSQFIGLSFVHSGSRPDQLTARAIVRPRLHSLSGSSKIYLTAELTPVVYGGTVVYRIKGRTYGANTSVRAIADGLALTDVRRVDGERFEIDLAPDLALALTAGGELQVSADVATGTVDKRGHLGLSLKKLAMTAGDVEQVWPPLSCTGAVRTCLLALPDGTLDLGGCGEAVVVNTCAGEVGVFVDDVSFQQALQAAGLRLSNPTAKSDAIGLVGADKADEWLFGAKETVEVGLQQLFGRWYLSATARTAALSGALDAGIDRAYARPLEIVEPHAPVPGNAQAMRHVVADALLAELDRMDFTSTEYARTLEQLTRQFRVRHVADIRRFRESIVPEPYPGQPDWDVYVDRWLDAYIEVAIDRTTGVIKSVLVEID